MLKTGSEITSDNFLDPGYDIRIDSEKRYDAPSPRIGFRVIAARKK
ncbi:MAG: hypothetical protein IKO62_10025 [Bacteroidales bacterium]|nr:hypothetical protein [Bacteroidales bacterium]